MNAFETLIWKAIRRADEAFEKTRDTGTKCWMRDYFLPSLETHGLEIRQKEKIAMGDTNIGWAVSQMREGKKVRRAGWNGKGMWLVLMPELRLPSHSSQEPGAKVNDRTAKHIGVDTPLHSQPYIAMWTAQGLWQPGWLCSQADLLATDWELA